jgi:hypothetical protein
MLGRGSAALRIFQIIFQIQDQKVAGAEAESRGFGADRSEIAISRGAVGVGVIVDGEVDLQDAVLAAEVFGFRYGAADGRARAGAAGWFLRAETRAGVEQAETDEYC